jgi:hypothetical protein
MMHEPPFKPFAVLTTILALVSAPLFADEGGGEEEDKAEYSQEPCGKLGGMPVFYRTRTEHTYGSRHSESWSNACSIDARTVSKGENGPDTAFEALLSWSEEVSGAPADNAFTVESCKAGKNSLTLLSGQTAIAEFTYQKGQLALAPGFRKKILDGMERNAPIGTAQLQTVLSGLEDPQIHEVLRAYAIGDSAAQGYVDYAIYASAECLREAQDKNVRKYCKRLSDSLSAWKKSEQPVFLVDARKAGTLLGAPVYPPLDAPTVFWKDSSLCVVQESEAKPTLMRAFDPRTGKWGPKAKLKYPESGMYQMFEKNTGTWSMGCNYETFCWSKKMGPISDDPCEGISCGPLIMLDDSAGGSVQSREDLSKAGGSAAAGDGGLEFFGGGMVRYLDSSKVAWKVLDGDLRYGTRPYGFQLTREYPVVVSPGQDWVAYALDSKDGKGIELWVARLKYKR